MCKLKDLSGALWNEDTCSIVLEHEHYLGNIKDHPKDIEFLNRPIELYHQMETSFGNTVATGRYAMGSSEPLGVFSGYGDNEGAKQQGENVVNQLNGDQEKAEVAEGSKAAEPTCGAKRKRSLMSEEEALLMTNMTNTINNVATALGETRPAYVDDALYDAVMGFPSFTEEALMAAHCHLLDNKSQGSRYLKMTNSHHVLWLRGWLSKHYYM